jgi:hypothetical protein
VKKCGRNKLGTDDYISIHVKYPVTLSDFNGF